MKNTGFTLIELLIVLAIVAVLGAIAAPNFEVAWIRSKVSQTRADMKSLRLAQEAYRADYKEYMPDTADENISWMMLTTPVAYIASIPTTQFPEVHGPYLFPFYRYYCGGISSSQRDRVSGLYLRQHAYAIDAPGPSRVCRFNYPDVWQYDSNYNVTIAEAPSLWQHLYDPSNGIVSMGDFIATQKKQYN